MGFGGPGGIAPSGDSDGTQKTNVINDYIIDIQRGLVPGQKIVRISGTNPNMQLDATETIWDVGGLYTYLTADTQLYVSSSSAADTGVTVVIFGMNDAGVEVTLTGSLDGQNQVPISGLAFRVFQIVVIAGDPEGDIYLAETDTLTGGVPDTTSKIKGKVILGNGSSRMALYTLPTGKSAYGLDSGYVAGKGDDIVFTPLLRPTGGIFISTDQFNLYQNSVIFPLNALPGVALDDFELRGKAGNSGANGYGFIDIVVIDD